MFKGRGLTFKNTETPTGLETQTPRDPGSRNLETQITVNPRPGDPTILCPIAHQNLGFNRPLESK